MAFAQLAACVAAMIPGGRGCGPELDNLESTVHELKVALNNLSRACPWVIL